MKKMHLFFATISLFLFSGPESPSSLPYKAIMNPSKGLFLGNSITVHPVASNLWWGSWGMAATSREKDYVHVFEKKVMLINPQFVATAANISMWEKNHKHFDLHSLDNLFSRNPDLVVLRLGENVEDLVGFQESTEKLISFIQTKSPKAKIYLTGNYWKNDTKEAALKAAAMSKGISFIKLDTIFTTRNSSYVGEIVMGDDGQEHKINREDVARHPGDQGHAAIAEAIFAAVFSE